MSEFEHWSLCWAALSAISSAVTLLFLTVAAVLTFRQIRESSRARQFGAALAVLTHTSTPELRSARRLIYTHHKEINQRVASNPTWQQLDEFFKEISAGTVDFHIFHTYLTSLENIAILVLHDLAPDEIVEMYFGRLAPHHWNALQPFVAYMRKFYGTDDHLQHFEMLITLIEQNGLEIQEDSEFPLLPLTASQMKKRMLLAKRRSARRSAFPGV